MRHRIEYSVVLIFAIFMRVLPRWAARALGVTLGLLVYAVHSRLRRVGSRNLDIAFPAGSSQEKSKKEKKRILRGVFRSLGRQLAEFCLFPRYTPQNVNEVAIYDGFQNFAEAVARGKGVLFLTGHFGGWEIGSFVHSLQGHPMKIVVRPLDNPLVDALGERYRTRFGNRTLSKQTSTRALLTALRQGEVVGILMDTNMTPPQGAFVDFFGVPACTATGVARVALHTGAAVVPAFTIWDKELGRYRVRFDPALPLVRTSDNDADTIANTAAFTKVIEDYARKYPDQWLWVHRRWKTRPLGDAPLY